MTAPTPREVLAGAIEAVTDDDYGLNRFRGSLVLADALIDHLNTVGYALTRREPLDVERLARAMDAVWARGSDVGLCFVAHENQPEYARRVAAEYERLGHE